MVSDIQIPGIPDDFATATGAEQGPFPTGQPGFEADVVDPGKNPFPTGQPGFEDCCTPAVAEVVSAATAFVAVDSNSDGVVDGYAIDTDGDGVSDLGVYRTPDGYWITADADNDGYSDGDTYLTESQMQVALPELWRALQSDVPATDTPAVEGDPGVTDGLDPAVSDPAVSDPVVVEDGRITGDPEDWAAVWFQQSYNNSCVPTSIAQIFNLYTGNSIDEEWFYRRAEELGMFQEIGNTGVLGLDPKNASILLGEAGIPAQFFQMGSSGITEQEYWNFLDAEVESGTGVMVMVDSAESVGQDTDGDATSATDHAVLITDIDWDRGMVVLNDPGRPEGAQMEVTLADFADAWQDSDHAMLVCDQSADEFQSANGIVSGDAAGSAATDTTLPESTGDAPLPFLEDITPPIDQGIAEQIRRHGWVLLPIAFALGSAGSRLVAKRARGV